MDGRNAWETREWLFTIWDTSVGAGVRRDARGAVSGRSGCHAVALGAAAADIGGEADAEIRQALGCYYPGH